MTRRRALWIGGVFAAVCVTCGGSRSLSRSIMFPGAAQRFPAPSVLERENMRLLRFTTSDGLALEAALAQSGTNDATTVVYFHGNGEAAANGLPMARILARSGFDVLLAEYRGYGGMPGSATEEGLYLDAEAAIAALQVPESRILLVGRSLGTGVATEMAKRGRGKAMVLISPYTSMVDMGGRMVGSLASVAIVDRFDTASKIGALTMPITIVHGTEDSIVPFHMGESLCALAPHCRLVALPGVGHNDIPDIANRITAAHANPPPR